jgi:hypothetical protein
MPADPLSVNPISRNGGRSAIASGMYVSTDIREGQGTLLKYVLARVLMVANQAGGVLGLRQSESKIRGHVIVNKQ